jgi:hypothetical protein
MSSPPKLSLNASGCTTWSKCTAQPHYVQANAHRIPPQDTQFSVEGTNAHTVVECLFKGKPLPDFATPEMIRHAEAFVAYCLPFESDWAHSELKVDLFYMPGRNGFVDWCSFSHDAIDICDYKYGQGVSVSAKENLQMAIYARSAIKQKRIPARPDTKVRLHIFQPRVRQGERVSMWEITFAELEQFTDDNVVGPSSLILSKGETVFAPGEKTCQFCPAKTFCVARAEWKVKGTPLEPVLRGEEAKLPPIDIISDDALAKILVNKSEIVSWLNGIEKYGLQMAASGRALPGTKIVASKGGHRSWSDPDEAKSMFLELVAAGKITKDQVIEEKLLTPKQAEEFEFDFGKDQWKEVQGLIFKPKGKPVLAPLDDPRPAYSASDVSADVFDENED